MIDVVLCRMAQCLSAGVVSAERRDDGQAARQIQEHMDEAEHFRRALAVARGMKYPPSQGELSWMEKMVQDNERWAAECRATSQFLTGR